MKDDQILEKFYAFLSEALEHQSIDAAATILDMTFRDYAKRLDPDFERKFEVRAKNK